MRDLGGGRPRRPVEVVCMHLWRIVRICDDYAMDRGREVEVCALCQVTRRA